MTHPATPAAPAPMSEEQRDEKMLDDLSWGDEDALYGIASRLSDRLHAARLEVDRLRSAPAAGVVVTECVDPETARTLLDLLNPLHAALDRQTYDAKVAGEFDLPADAEHEDITITAQMDRDLTQAVCILENRLAALHKDPAP